MQNLDQAANKIHEIQSTSEKYFRTKSKIRSMKNGTGTTFRDKQYALT